jgi:uncharacterized protein (TIGR02147 family)
MQTGQMIFYFEDPIAFLNSQLRERQKRNPKFSLRAWARQLGYENPSLLFQVLKGERRLKMDLAIKIAANLKLKGKALRYFELIVLNSTCTTENERRVFEQMMAKIRPKSVQTLDDLSVEIFSAISDWYHSAIPVLTTLVDFEPNINWIQERLGGEIDKKTVKAAIDRLVKLGLLVQHEDGGLARAGDNPRFVHTDVPSEAIRQHHKQMIEKAFTAVDRQTRDERHNMGATLSLKIADLPQAIEIISDAHRQIMALAAVNDGEEVYQFNTQLFRLSKKKPERSH